jgi:hypothetical protein
MAKLVCSLGTTPCQLSGEKRTSQIEAAMSAYDAVDGSSTGT